jgi:uncharacterized membrane protein YhaH (DUF805 family)
MHWYTDVLKKYAVFDGRATRPEYWWFTLISTIISVVLRLVIGGTAGQSLSAIYGLAVLLPALGVGIRRLHDTNHSGWWLLIALLPIIGWIWIIILLATDSDDGPNRYGYPAGEDAPGGAASPRFDAATGRPITGYDPQTGEPVLGDRDTP